MVLIPRSQAMIGRIEAYGGPLDHYCRIKIKLARAAGDRGKMQQLAGKCQAAASPDEALAEACSSASGMARAPKAQYKLQNSMRQIGDSLLAGNSLGIAELRPVLSVTIIRRIWGGFKQTSVETVGLMKKADSKLLKLVGRLLALLATDAYASGEGFEFMIVEQDIADCLDRLPLPQNLKQVRGTVYQTKGKGDAKERALWLVTNRASLSPKLTDDVALYILNCSDDRRIGVNLLQRTELSELVRAEAAKLAEPEQRNRAEME